MNRHERRPGDTLQSPLACNAAVSEAKAMAVRETETGEHGPAARPHRTNALLALLPCNAAVSKVIANMRLAAARLFSLFHRTQDVAEHVVLHSGQGVINLRG